MSELKIYHFDEWHNPYTEFYIKSEADKVIAHQKYKRCLAMAIRCGIGAQFEHDKVIRFMKNEGKVRVLINGHRKWIEKNIAEKFKEAK